jgi:hypothetical protein
MPRLAGGAVHYSDDEGRTYVLPGGSEVPAEHVQFIANPKAWEDGVVPKASRKSSSKATADGAAADAADSSDGDGSASGDLVPERPKLEDMKVEDLKTLAADRQVDLGGAKSKADIIAALEAADVTGPVPPSE